MFKIVFYAIFVGFLILGGLVKLLNKKNFTNFLIAISATVGLTLSLVTINDNTVKFIGEHMITKDSKCGINRILRQGNPYRTRTGGRSIPPLGGEYISSDEKGFDFVTHLLQRTYFQKFCSDILLFGNFQRQHHIHGDPNNPLLTKREIYLVPLNPETEVKKDLVKSWSATWPKYGELISYELDFTTTLHEYYKTLVRIWSAVFIFISIILNINIRNKD